MLVVELELLVDNAEEFAMALEKFSVAGPLAIIANAISISLDIV